VNWWSFRSLGGDKSDARKPVRGAAKFLPLAPTVSPSVDAHASRDAIVAVVNGRPVWKSEVEDAMRAGERK
jgi:hypothetical protein